MLGPKGSSSLDQNPEHRPIKTGGWNLPCGQEEQLTIISNFEVSITDKS